MPLNIVTQIYTIKNCVILSVEWLFSYNIVSKLFLLLIIHFRGFKLLCLFYVLCSLFMPVV